jgi:hypothetical protein
MLKSLLGKRFGKYTVTDQAKSKNWKRRWVCRCSCGTERVISTEHLTSGKRTGCNACNNGNLKRPFEGRYNFLCYMAKGRCEVTLTYEEYVVFSVNKHCHYCNVVIKWEPHGNFSDGHHLDRKDNSLGYSKENCVVCCGRCNQLKSDQFTYEQMLQIGALIRSWKDKE